MLEKTKKLEGVLKVLEKAEFNNMKIQDIYMIVNSLNDFSRTVKELRDYKPEPVVEKKVKKK